MQEQEQGQVAVSSWETLVAWAAELGVLVDRESDGWVKMYSPLTYNTGLFHVSEQGRQAASDWLLSERAVQVWEVSYAQAEAAACAEAASLAHSSWWGRLKAWLLRW
jgi:hypothetical protein